MKSDRHRKYGVCVCVWTLSVALKFVSSHSVQTSAALICKFCYWYDGWLRREFRHETILQFTVYNSIDTEFVVEMKSGERGEYPYRAGSSKMKKEIEIHFTIISLKLS